MFLALVPSGDPLPEEPPPSARVCAYPNPFAHSTTIRYHLPAAGLVRLGIYDVAGRLVRVLDESVRPRGWGSAEWDGRDGASKGVAAGVYFVRVEAGRGSSSRKVLLLK